MSVVDLVLILLTLLFALSGFRQGLLVSATSIVGFLGGAVLGAQLARPVADRVDGSSVTRVSPSRAQRATSRPSGTRSRSKTWDGCPSSSIT